MTLEIDEVVTEPVIIIQRTDELGHAAVGLASVLGLADRLVKNKEVRDEFTLVAIKKCVDMFGPDVVTKFSEYWKDLYEAHKEMFEVVLSSEESLQTEETA